MKQGWLRENFISVGKMLTVLILFVSSMLSIEEGEISVSLYLFVGALFYSSTALFSFIGKYRRIFLVIEMISLIWLFHIGLVQAVYFTPVVLLDFMYCFHFPSTLYFGVLGTPFLFMKYVNVDYALFFLDATFFVILYYQTFVVIESYRKSINYNYVQESQLKNTIQSKEQRHQLEMKKSRLVFENELLQEKADISQALHDKLGHSINGSLYQLEACKAIMDQQPEEAKKILQGVIDTLRSSMDEIRLILRREKPDKKQMALLQLRSLCEECKEKYQIDVELNISESDRQVPEQLWEIILDNTYEAVSNALKYSHCSRIEIQIYILNEVLRCTIRDNGIGCSEVIDGMGLAGMKQRVRAVKGYMDISSKTGFQINIILPLV